MVVNPYFLHGSRSEQGLLQDLINEQIKMYGLDVYYIPRKYIKTDNIIKEVHSSAFDDTFIIEAYLDNYEGYTPGSDLMTKFGINLKNEVSLIISKERFEAFITPLLQNLIDTDDQYDNDSGDLLFASRPKEGDLIFFPLGDRLFEIKRVEFEVPFYQLNKNYTYELKCELFEYEDEYINTDIEELQDAMKTIGYITELTLTSIGSTATAQASIASTGSVGKIYLNNDGFGYTTSPTVSIEAPPAGGEQATAVALTRQVSGALRALTDIVLVNAGFGYSVAPQIVISGGGGTGAAATASIVNGAVYKVDIIDGGENYYLTPDVTLSGPLGVGVTALGIANISVGGTISSVYLSNAGAEYTVSPTVVIEAPNLIGFGTFIKGEEVVGQTSGTVATVKEWINLGQNVDKTLKLHVNSGEFSPGEIVVGTASSAQYSIKQYNTDSLNDKYRENKQLEDEGDLILDFSETNPFGEF